MAEEIRCPTCGVHIDEHEASDCLNAWIAIDIMGEEKPTIEHDHFHLESIDSEGGNWYCLKEYDKGDVCVWHPINFSGYIGSAWKVIEKLNSSGFIVEIINDCIAWSVVFQNIDTDKRFIADWKDSIEVQICKAAIMAVLSDA